MKTNELYGCFLRRISEDKNQKQLKFKGNLLGSDMLLCYDLTATTCLYKDLGY